MKLEARARNIVGVYPPGILEYFAQTEMKISIGNQDQVKNHAEKSEIIEIIFTDSNACSPVARRLARYYPDSG